MRDLPRHRDVRPKPHPYSAAKSPGQGHPGLGLPLLGQPGAVWGKELVPKGRGKWQRKIWLVLSSRLGLPWAMLFPLILLLLCHLQAVSGGFSHFRCPS